MSFTEHSCELKPRPPLAPASPTVLQGGTLRSPRSGHGEKGLGARKPGRYPQGGETQAGRNPYGVCSPHSSPRGSWSSVWLGKPGTAPACVMPSRAAHWPRGSSWAEVRSGGRGRAWQPLLWAGEVIVLQRGKGLLLATLLEGSATRVPLTRGAESSHSFQLFLLLVLKIAFANVWRPVCFILTTSRLE